jgi:muconate cycloisomerase
VDANQGWDRITALRTAKRLDEYQLDFIEQPVPRWDIAGMAAVAKAIDTPVMADESLCTTHDAIQLVKHEAASVFGIKLTKAGGFLNCKRQAAIAEAAGIKCYVGCMVETGLGTSAYLHFAVSTPAVTMGCELFGPLLLADDIVKESTKYEGGHIVSNSRPGLGVTLDEAKVKKYARG